MPRLTIKETQGAIIIIAVLLTPFLGLVEVADLLGFFGGVFQIELWKVKILKDILLFFSVSYFIFFSKTGFHLTLKLSTALMLSIVILSVSISLFFVEIEAIAAGFRWLLPFIFYLTLRSQEKSFYVKISRLLSFILVVGLLLQMFQYFYMDGIYGLDDFGFSVRNPGYYLIPSSMAALAMSTLYFVVRHESWRPLRAVIYISALLSIILTASGTGFISFSLFTLFYFGRAGGFRLKIFWAVAISLAVLAFLPALTNRENILSSLLTRVEIFVSHADVLKLIFSNGFGVGTNSLINLRPDLLDSGGAIIADSMLSSSIINLGVLFLCVSVYEIFVKPMKNIGRDVLLYISSFLPFYLTVVLFELFPVNILMFVALAELVFDRKSIENNSLTLVGTRA